MRVNLKPETRDRLRRQRAESRAATTRSLLRRLEARADQPDGEIYAEMLADLLARYTRDGLPR